MWRIQIADFKDDPPIKRRWLVNRHGAIVEYRLEERHLAEAHIKRIAESKMLKLNDWEYTIVEI